MNIVLKTLILKLAPSYLPNLIRQGALLAAGALLSNGIVDADGATAVAGGLTALGAGLWAFAEKQGFLARLI